MTEKTPLRVLQIVTQLERAGAQGMAHWLEGQLAPITEVHTVFLYHKSHSDLFDESSCLMPTRPKSFKEIAVLLVRLLRLRKEEYSVVLAHTHYAIALLTLCALVQHPRRRPTLLAVHHWPISRYPIAVRALIRLSRPLGLISHNVYVSPAIQGSRVGTTIPNPIPAPRAQRQEGIPKVDILVVARHSAEKALDRIITAMPLLEEGRSLTLLGDGPLSSQLMDLASRSKAGERIQFLGSLPTQEVRQAMANCRCLVLPSRWEAMPMVLLEAIAEDAPILVSRIPEHELFIENGAALPFEGDDPRSLVAAIKALENSATQASLASGRAALRVTLNESAIGMQWKALVANYQSLRETHPHPSPLDQGLH